MTWKPIGHRLLVLPDAPPEQTDSGLVLPQDRDHVPVTGTVVALGCGPARDTQIRTATIARCIRIVEELADEAAIADPETHDLVSNVREELRRYLGQVERYTPPVQVGDRVVFPDDAGLTLTTDGETYIVLNEDEVAVIATEEEQAA